MTSVRQLYLERFDASAVMPASPIEAHLPSETQHPERIPQQDVCENGAAPHSDGPDDQGEQPADAVDEAMVLLNKEASQFRAAVSAFLEARQDLQSRFNERLAQSLTDACCQLLPKIGKAFFADEIARHLAELPTPLACQIKLEVATASARLVLTQALSEAGLAESVIDIVEKPNLKAMQVKVAWEDGGIDFEFDRLLQQLCTTDALMEPAVGCLGEHDD